MATESALTGNATLPLDPPRAVMMSIAEIAKRDSVSKPGVSRTVKRLAADHGLTVERDGQGRVAAVNVAEYDHLRSRHGDPSKAQAPRAARTSRSSENESHVAPGESYNDALRTKTWLEAERSRLALAEQKRELIRVAAVDDALGEAGIEIARIINRLPNVADDLAIAVARDGAHGMRVMLKTIAQKMRSDIADALALAASGESETEDAAHA